MRSNIQVKYKHTTVQLLFLYLHIKIIKKIIKII